MLDTDNPSDREDVYHRGTLAKRIAHILANPLSKQSLVVALEGPWGSGKSWLVEKSVEHLKSQGSTVIQFNPWVIGEEQDLILNFLIQMALEIRPIEAAAGRAIESSKRAASTFIQYARALSYGRYLPIPIIKEIGELINDHAEALDTATEILKSKKSVPSLSEARSAAREAISHMESRLIVVIDDIDRLRSREIRAVMQLVKSVLDFPNTSFLLAFDSEHVARSLAEDGDYDKGMRYLEKIVQLSIQMPAMDGQLAFDSINERFHVILSETKHKLHQHEEISIREALPLVADLCIKTRDILRWSNRLAWNLDALKNSVNAADLCVIEMLYLCLDKGEWNTLLKHQSQQETIQHAGVSSNIGSSPIEIDADKIDKEFNSVPKVNSVKFILFPKNLDATDIRRNRRLADKTIWAHYQKNNTGALKINGAEADRIIRDTESLEKLKHNLKKPEEQKSALLQISEITQYIRPTSISNNSDVIEIMCDIINIIYGIDNSHNICNSENVNSGIVDPFDITLNLFVSLEKDAIDETFNKLDIYAAAETGLRFTEFNNSSDERSSSSSYSTGNHLAGKAIARMESKFHTIDDKINYSHLIIIYSKMKGRDNAKNTLNSIIKTPNGLQKIGAELSIKNGPKLHRILELIENLDDFSKQLENLVDNETLNLIERYRNLSSQDNS